jgi:hypothetical protein
LEIESNYSSRHVEQPYRDIFQLDSNGETGLFGTNRERNTERVVWMCMFDQPFDHHIYTMTATANLYVNDDAFSTFEIFQVLKKSNVRKRHHPPTITKVANVPIRR